MSTGWDNATLKKLKALTVKGLSTSEIGKRLGMSKNAIVGKLNRLGWNAKAGGADKKAKDVKADTKKATVATKTVKKTEKKTVDKSVKVVKKETLKKTVKVPVEKPVTEKKATVKKAADKKTEQKDVVKAPAVKEEKSTKSSAKNLAVHQRIIQHSLEMANLKPNQCRWPIGDPDSEHFHFCGETVFVGKPYCYEHCKHAYQFTPPKKK
jgi:GcrA cell cycle regulator